MPRYGRHSKVCRGRASIIYRGRYAEVGPTYITRRAELRRTAAGLVTYDYDQLVSCLANVLPGRHDAIEWIHKKVIPLSPKIVNIRG